MDSFRLNLIRTKPIFYNMEKNHQMKGTKIFYPVKMIPKKWGILFLTLHFGSISKSRGYGSKLHDYSNSLGKKGTDTFTNNLGLGSNNSGLGSTKPRSRLEC